jgi:hypothetical protein
VDLAIEESLSVMELRKRKGRTLAARSGKGQWKASAAASSSLRKATQAAACRARKKRLKDGGSGGEQLTR